MRKSIYIILLLGCVLPSFFSCGPQYSNNDWIRLADEQVGKSTDSLKVLLNQVKGPLELQGEDRLLYGWLSGYVHAKKGTSMQTNAPSRPFFYIFFSRQKPHLYRFRVLSEADIRVLK